MSRRLRATALAVAGVIGLVTAALSPSPAAAAHWAFQGGDAGRSGFQPVDPGGVPVDPLYSSVRTADRNIRTSPVVTEGAPDTQRLIYGTNDSVIHLRLLSSGKVVGIDPGIALSAAADPFGGGTGSVSFADSSTPAGLGQVFAVHNEQYQGGIVGLQIAQIDETSGLRARDDYDVPNTLGYRIQSSALLGPVEDGAGTRSLFFVAGQQNGSNEQLFKVPISNPTSSAAVINTPVVSPDINANIQASPSLVYLRNASGATTAYIAVPTIDGLATLAVSDLSPGPSGAGLGGPGHTPSVPATSTGEAPQPAPVIFIASGGTDSTVAHALTQVGNAQVLTDTQSPVLAGGAAPGLMTDGTRVVVSTSKNLYSLSASDMTVAARLDPGDGLAAGTSGFSATTAAGTGSVVAIVRDGGQQLVLERDTLQPVAGDLFTAFPGSAGSLSSFGQPAISHRFLVEGSDRGLFVYGLRQAAPPTGYWLAASDGGIFNYGDADFFGSTGDIKLNRPIVTMADTTSHRGYWLAATDGGIFSYGDADFFGSTGDIPLNKPIVGMVPTRSSQGYWLVASDGGVFNFGDAAFLGSTGDIHLNSPIVGMAATPSGDGYWLVAADGGIFAFGDAQFAGSTGDIHLNKPIVGMSALPNGSGYWMTATDGGVFAFGKAGFFGSTGDIPLNSPIVAMTASATGQGYLFVAADGGVFNFGDAPFLGSAASLGKLNRPVVSIAAKP